jgi:hypothetical protein
MNECEKPSHTPFYSTATDYVKGLLGVSETFSEDFPQDPVREIHNLTDEELFRVGEKCLREITDDIIVLSEIRARFGKRGGTILGYNGWKDFVARNSKYSIRTVQNRLAEVRGKDASKVNKITGNRYTRLTRAEQIAEDKAAGTYTNSFKAAQLANVEIRAARKASANADLRYRLAALLPIQCDGIHAFESAVRDALQEKTSVESVRATIAAFQKVIKEFEGYVAKFESKVK